VVLQCRVQPIEACHSSMSSTDVALAAARSFTVISVSAKVSL
jgi:hypothetical protein